MIAAEHPAPPMRPLSTWNRVGMALRWVALETGLDVDDLLGRCREARFSRARAAVAWVARHTSDRTLQQIAYALGRSDHTNVLWMLATAEKLRDRDPAFRMLTDRVADRVRAGEQP